MVGRAYKVVHSEKPTPGAGAYEAPSLVDKLKNKPVRFPFAWRCCTVAVCLYWLPLVRRLLETAYLGPLQSDFTILFQRNGPGPVLTKWRCERPGLLRMSWRPTLFVLFAAQGQPPDERPCQQAVVSICFEGRGQSTMRRLACVYCA